MPASQISVIVVFSNNMIDFLYTPSRSKVEDGIIGKQRRPERFIESFTGGTQYILHSLMGLVLNSMVPRLYQVDQAHDMTFASRGYTSCTDFDGADSCGNFSCYP